MQSCCNVLHCLEHDAGDSADMQAEYEFPRFVGHRRRLPLDDQLFHDGNVERELFAKQLAIQVGFVQVACRVWLSSCILWIQMSLSCKHSCLYRFQHDPQVFPHMLLPGNFSNFKQIQCSDPTGCMILMFCWQIFVAYRSLPLSGHVNPWLATV